MPYPARPQLPGKPSLALVKEPYAAAANAGSEPLPKVDDVFKFPGVGRSGAGVKNPSALRTRSRVGPALGESLSPTIKGVISTSLAIVKPWRSGQGFVSGDGRKPAPTPEQLG